MAVALVDASAAVEVEVVASPFVGRRHPERLVAGEQVVVVQVAETEPVCELEQRDEEVMTSFGQLQMIRIRKEKLLHRRLYLLQCATLLLPRW